MRPDFFALFRTILIVFALILSADLVADMQLRSTREAIKFTREQQATQLERLFHREEN